MLKIKRYIIYILALCSTAQASQGLSGAFTAGQDFLEKARYIKSKYASPAETMPELTEMVHNILSKVEAEINEGDDRYAIFKTIKASAEHDIQARNLNLHRLNYLTFQLAVALNPSASNHFDIFSGFTTLMSNQIWKLPYDEAYEAVSEYIEQQKASISSPVDNKAYENLKNFRDLLFMPSDRGFWVFPYVMEKPTYGIRTYLEAFAEQIIFVGLPLKAQNCTVHTSLIQQGEHAYFWGHDLLHVQALAPSLNLEESQSHITAMASVVQDLLPVIAKQDTATQRKAYGVLFWLTHELLNYSEPNTPLFNASSSTADIFARMLSHSQHYLDEYLPAALENKDSYYRHHLTYMKQEEFKDDKPINYFKLEEGDILHIVEDTQSAQTAKDSGYLPSALFFEEDKNVILAFRKEDPDRKGGYTVSNTYINIFSSWENQRKFTYAFANLMKYMGVSDGQGTYGKTLAEYNPATANQMIHTLLTEFGQDYEPFLKN
jgi:hypothetical protein